MNLKRTAYLGSESLAVDSPIEQIFAELLPKSILVKGGLRVQAQYKLERFRYDFALTFRAASRTDVPPDLLVECDGREYHYTAEQRLNDVLKNECAERNRIKLIRFSGRDLHKSPSICIDSIILAAQELRLA